MNFWFRLTRVFRQLKAKAKTVRHNCRATATTRQMASKSFSEEDFSCPVCYNIYNDPVFLTCTHSICNTCLQQFWETKASRECPICRRKCSKDIYPVNRILKNLCETFQQQRSQGEPFCSLHRSELKLFCEDDKQLVCLVCRDSKLHKNHNFSPISEAAPEHKVRLVVINCFHIVNDVGKLYGCCL